MRPVLALATVVGAALALSPHVASACSFLACSDGYAHPADGRRIPANTSALLLRPPASGWSDPTPAIELRGPDDAPVPVTPRAEPEVAPATLLRVDELSPGRHLLTATGTGCQTAAPLQVAFTVEAPAPLPTSLGTLGAGEVQQGPLRRASLSGECSTSALAAAVRVQVELSDDAQPWSSLLMYRTLVDGEPWTPRSTITQELPVGSSWRGRGVDELYVDCAGDADRGATPGLSEGTHTVVMQGWLPGSNRRLETPPIEVLLTCESGGCACTTPTGGRTAPLLVVAFWFGLRRRRRSPS